MKLLIPVSAHDISRLDNFISTLLHFGGLEGFPILFHPTPEVSEQVHTQAQRLSVYRPQVIPTERNFENGAPVACSQHFASAVHMLGRIGNRDPWLWMELDMLPVAKDWATKLQREYTSLDKPFLGNVVQVPYWNEVEKKLEYKSGDNMLMGCAVYPPHMDKDHRTKALIGVLSRPLGHNPRQPFDLYLRHAFKGIGWADTKLISDQWNTCNYRWEGGQLHCDSMPLDPKFRARGGAVSPEAVLVHGCKDDSLFQAATAGGKRLTAKDIEAGFQKWADSLPPGIPIESRPDTPETRAEDEASERELAEELAAQDTPTTKEEFIPPAEKPTVAELVTGKTTTLRHVASLTGKTEAEIREELKTIGYKVWKGGRIVPV